MTTPVLEMLPSCADRMLAPVSVPGALLSVKLMSLSAWPALRITLASNRFVSVTSMKPFPVVKSALAASAPSEPAPLPVNVMAAASALDSPEAKASAKSPPETIVDCGCSHFPPSSKFLSFGQRLAHDMPTHVFKSLW